MDQEYVIEEIAALTQWWVNERKKKLREQLSDTMAVNPFLLPAISEIHNLNTIEEITDLIVASHLMIGHSTGFGKLIDEKILPIVFKTIKLDKKFRKKHPPFQMSCFDEIDHIVQGDSGTFELLSLKASKWTIQLTMAVQLNKAFKEVSEVTQQHFEKFSNIVVGTYYGQKKYLTDKYDILRGINRGARHDVVDLTDKIFIYAGKEFWKWLNHGVPETQEWVLNGIIKGLEASKSRESCRQLMGSFKTKISRDYDRFLDDKGNVDWHKLLKDING